MRGNRQPSKKNATSFKPGQSGNLAGRPKIDDASKEYLRRHRGEMTIKALKTTRRLLDSENEHVAARVANDWLNKILPDATHIEEQFVRFLERLRTSVDAVTYEKVLQVAADLDHVAPESR